VVAEEFFVEDPVRGVGADVDVHEGVGEESGWGVSWGGGWEGGTDSWRGFSGLGSAIVVDFAKAIAGLSEEDTIEGFKDWRRALGTVLMACKGG
jgi:hypothetical protein